MKEILIIEDAEQIRETYKRHLNRSGEFVFAEAATAEDATSLLFSMSFDHVICDYTLERGTGRDVFRWLQENRPEQLERFTFVCGITSDVADLDAMVLWKLDSNLYGDLLSRVLGQPMEGQL